MNGPSLFNTLLTALGVRHTPDYSAMRVSTIPFKSMFGLTKLLKEYGIDSQGIRLDPKEEYDELPVPFIARIDNSLTVVTEVSPVGVTAISDANTPEPIPRDEFLKRWSGIALLAYPDSTAIEPDYKAHRRDEIAATAKKWILSGTILFLFGYLFISNGLYRHLSTILLTLINLGGLFITYLLVLKQMSIHTHAADKICGVIQQNGCNTVLETKAAKFFGLFGWSEVGFAYFGVSLLALLMFPQQIGNLAIANLCCLPFSFWSVWYQKNRAKAWCTLCLCVQCALWLLFICYLTGGWIRSPFPLHIELFTLGASYLATLLVINRVLPHFDRSTKK